MVENFEDVANTNLFLSGNGNQWFWIGNFNQISVFQNSDSNFTYWDSGEPDNRGSNDENCVAIYRAHDGRWHDRQCEDKLHAICAVRATSLIPPHRPSYGTTPRRPVDSTSPS